MRNSISIVFKEMVFPFWTRSPQRVKAWGALLLTLLLVGGNVYCLVLLNKWNQAFYDALQSLNRSEFFHQLLIFFLIAGGYVLITVYKFYVMQRLMLAWRDWLTQKNMQLWLSHKGYYFWHLHKDTDHQNDNPDQRISEDVRELTELVLSCGEKIFREVITFVSFIGILWVLSGNLLIEDFFGYRVQWSHYLVWICLLYAVVGTAVIHWIGKPLIPLNFFQQKFEADFRYYLVRLRENSESIALSHGEEVENRNLATRLAKLVQNYRGLIQKQKQLLLANNAYSQVAYIFPFLVASPRLFAKEISLGQLFQISSAFGQVQGSVSVFITLYAELARLKSVIDRLQGFLHSSHSARKLHERASEKILLEDRSDFAIRNLSLKTPQEKLLFAGLQSSIPIGAKVLIKAPSGTGKSTLIRTLQNLWPFFEGHITLPRAASILTLPQKPYLVVGALKDSLTYPRPAETYSDESVNRLLDSCKLSHLKSRLHEEDTWDLKLSPGEQQRVSFIRALLHKPDVVLLDEATSAVDEETQRYLYQLLLQNQPDITLVTVAPREILPGIHTLIIDLPGVAVQSDS